MTEQQVDWSTFEVPELLRAAYGLTHQMDGVSRTKVHTRGEAAERREKVADLRRQRDMIDAEIFRRCAPEA